MSGIIKWGIFFISLLLTANSPFCSALADDEHNEKRWYQKLFDDDDDHGRDKKKKRYQKRSRENREHHQKGTLSPLNTTFKEDCGTCHFAYQPELLPSDSWAKILAGLEDHFGESIEMDTDSKKEISKYIKSNAADQSSGELAVKIMKKLGNRFPQRITEVPYIRKKHRKISVDILRRESIGSLSNCTACHPGATKGIYEDDDVVIPR